MKLEKIVLITAVLAMLLIAGCVDQTDSSSNRTSSVGIDPRSSRAALPQQLPQTGGELPPAGEEMPLDEASQAIGETPSEVPPNSEQYPQDFPQDLPEDLPPSNVKEFDITAKQFEFIPEKIIVTRGDTVKLNITSIDAEYGFSLPGFEISERLPENQTVVIEFVADKEGAFTISCSVFCGSDHDDMKGTLIVN